MAGVTRTMGMAVLIFLGSGLGGVARWALGGWLTSRLGSGFPWGTLVVNVTGSFVIGLFGTLTGSGGRWEIAPAGRLFFMVGVCGGYTTFSSFSHQTLQLAEEGQWLGAGTNVVLSVVLCLAGVWLGHLAGGLWNPPGGGSSHP